MTKTALASHWLFADGNHYHQQIALSQFIFKFGPLCVESLLKEAAWRARRTWTGTASRAMRRQWHRERWRKDVERGGWTPAGVDLMLFGVAEPLHSVRGTPAQEAFLKDVLLWDPSQDALLFAFPHAYSLESTAQARYDFYGYPIDGGAGTTTPKTRARFDVRAGTAVFPMYEAVAVEKNATRAGFVPDFTTDPRYEGLWSGTYHCGGHRYHQTEAMKKLVESWKKTVEEERRRLNLTKPVRPPMSDVGFIGSK